MRSFLTLAAFLGLMGAGNAEPQTNQQAAMQSPPIPGKYFLGIKETILKTSSSITWTLMDSNNVTVEGPTTSTTGMGEIPGTPSRSSVAWLMTFPNNINNSYITFVMNVDAGEPYIPCNIAWASARQAGVEAGFVVPCKKGD